LAVVLSGQVPLVLPQRNVLWCVEIMSTCNTAPQAPWDCRTYHAAYRSSSGHNGVEENRSKSLHHDGAVSTKWAWPYRGCLSHHHGSTYNPLAAVTSCLSLVTFCKAPDSYLIPLTHHDGNTTCAQLQSSTEATPTLKYTELGHQYGSSLKQR
jgi:hypothetical protein